jgi:hypothetical protein
MDRNKWTYTLKRVDTCISKKAIASGSKYLTGMHLVRHVSVCRITHFITSIWIGVLKHLLFGMEVIASIRRLIRTYFVRSKLICQLCPDLHVSIY